MDCKDEDLVKTLVLSIITIIYTAIMIDLILFKLEPWPYSSGSDVETVLIKSSIFYVQKESHCTYFQPKGGILPFLYLTQLIVPILFPRLLNLRDKTLSLEGQNDKNGSSNTRILRFVSTVVISIWLLFLVTFNTVLCIVEKYKHAKSNPYSNYYETRSFPAYFFDDFSSGIVGLTLYLVIPICLSFIIQYHRNKNRYPSFQGKYAATFVLVSLFILFSMFSSRLTSCA